MRGLLYVKSVHGEFLFELEETSGKIPSQVIDLSYSVSDTSGELTLSQFVSGNDSSHAREQRVLEHQTELSRLEEQYVQCCKRFEQAELDEDTSAIGELYLQKKSLEKNLNVLRGKETLEYEETEQRKFFKLKPGILVCVELESKEKVVLGMFCWMPKAQPSISQSKRAAKCSLSGDLIDSKDQADNLYHTSTNFDKLILSQSTQQHDQSDWTLTVSSAYSGLNPANTKESLIDGSFDTGAATNEAGWIMATFPQPVTVRRIELAPLFQNPNAWNCTNGSGGSIQYSVDGINWTELCKILLTSNRERCVHDVNGPEARYFRLHHNGYLGTSALFFY